MRNKLAEEYKALEEEKKRVMAMAAAVAVAAVKGEGLEREVDLKSLNLDKAPVIGVGGFGRVHRAMYRNTEVAVKTLVTSGSAQELIDFKKEIALVLLVLRLVLSLQFNLCQVMSLSHPRLVNFMAACTQPPELALVMVLCFVYYDNSHCDVGMDGR